ncbi:hypothetical protein [Streptomyces sp. NPDC060205]|uniref:hypothetical protein n=1 Tax=Streptomyces sp. NPDC060205 TaxID=3347072 RepID=UPI003655D93D
MGTSWWQRHRNTVVAALLNVLAYTGAAVAGRYEWLFWIAVAAGVLATFGLVLTASQNVLVGKKLAETAANAQRRLLQEMLVPIIEVLGEIAVAATPDQRRGLQERMKHAVITAARAVGPADSRACFLDVEGAPGARTLRCSPGMWVGRQDTPRTVYSEGSPRGDRLLRHMDNRSPLFVEDLDREADVMQPDNNKYKTFIAAAVAPACNHQAFGILSIDSLNPGDLTTEDEKIIEVLGQLLGSALAMN